MKRIAYNDVLEKGFDSVAQECFLWINKPELAAKIFDRHGHAPDWNRLKRDKGGRYHHIAKVTERLIRLADSFDQAGKTVAADKVDNLAQYILSQMK
jgi:hypothetical protein